MRQNPEFHIISMSTYGVGLSGGDRIWIELSKRIGKKYPVFVYLWEEGIVIAKREGLKEAKFVLWSSRFGAKLGFFINYFIRVFISIWEGLNLKLENSVNTIVYSASEFWQDSFPAVILKLRYPKIIWIAAWYQSAPNPFLGFVEGGLIKLVPDLRAFLYWLVQLPVKPLIRRFANIVFVTSQPDRVQFPKQDILGKVVVIKGGVDIKKIKNLKFKTQNSKKKYDAVFQGRLHPQKGVLELVDIWRYVVNDKPNAKLAMIGDGPLMDDLKLKIKNLKMEKNIYLFGYVFDGPKKYRIFSQSKIVVHPALYDSGGMAAAEAMSFGMPGVSFDLKALKTYYPKGMVKVPIGENKKFAEMILKLLSNPSFYNQQKRDAINLIKTVWSWDKLVGKILKIIDLDILMTKRYSSLE